MNIHHLELFYYVARHGGISRAVQRMPYGIQQPAVSGQILLLEQDFGARLFERNPFRLTPEGEELYAFVRPFFENLEAVGSRLRKRAAPLLRIGAAEFVLREHVPAVIQRLRKLHPGIRLGLRSGYDYELEAWLQERQIDFAVTAVDHHLPANLHSLPLLHLPLVLLVPKKSKYKAAGEFWTQSTVEEPLISLPAVEPVTRLFQKGLRRLKVDWPVSIEASSMDLIAWYVANGQGIGVSVALVTIERRAGIRVLPLPGFDPIVIAALWRGKATPLITALLEEGRRYVREIWPQWQCEDAIPTPRARGTA
jgi:DNA-binding transcriptional LysR family regulator